MRLTERATCEATRYAGREMTLATCERIGVPLLIVNEHGQTTVLRRVSELTTRGEAPSTDIDRTVGEGSPMSAGFKHFTTAQASNSTPDALDAQNSSASSRGSQEASR